MLFTLLAQAVPVELFKFLPDATAAVAVIAVVMLFQRQQDKQAEGVKEMTETFQETVKDLTHQHRESIAEISRRESDTRLHFQTQLQALLDSNLDSRKELIEGFKDLRLSIETVMRRPNDTTKATSP